MSGTLYLCLHVSDFAAQAMSCQHPELRTRPVAILSGKPPLEYVFARNESARSLGLELGMSRLQAESFADMAILRRGLAQEELAFEALMECAKRFSPKIEVLTFPAQEISGATLVLDVSASERLFGSAEQIARSLSRRVQGAGYKTNIAVSRNAYAAVLAARGLNGVTVITGGHESATLAPLPLVVLELDAEQEQTFAAWGIRTLGGLAALPRKALISRMGQTAGRLQALARGEYSHLLVPDEPAADAPLIEDAELEHPVELLEPLLFLLSRMLEQITQHAAERSLAIASVETRLALDDAAHGEHRRIIRPAVPERNHHTLLKLIQLDLEAHPPEAAVVALHMVAQPARPQTAQQGLFIPQSPEAGRLELLLARLRKLVGEDRIGAPELLASHRPDAFHMTPFRVDDGAFDQATARRVSACVQRTPVLRMVRPPRTVQVKTRGTEPVMMIFDGKTLMIQERSGPWRSSGEWWTHPNWCREEWDIVLNEVQPRSLEAKPRSCFRLAYDPGSDCWYLIGIYD